MYEAIPAFNWVHFDRFDNKRRVVEVTFLLMFYETVEAMKEHLYVNRKFIYCK